MEPAVHYVTAADGIRIAYTVTGDGPPLLYCQEPMVSHAQLEWSHPVIGREFAELARYHTLIRFDPRGSGLSDRLKPQSVDDTALDIEAVAQRVGFERVALVGVQPAALGAVVFAARHPQQIDGIVLVNGFARLGDMLGTQQVRALVAAAHVDWITATEALGFAAFGSGRDESRDFGAYIRSCVSHEYFATVPRTATWQVEDEAANIRSPTLILKHEGVHFVTMDMVKDLAARIPNAQLAVLEGGWGNDPVGLARRTSSFITGRTPEPVRDSAPETRSPAGGRLVTIVFTDIERNTEMLQRLGDAAWRALLREHERITRDLLIHHVGHEVKTIGDAFMMSFGSATQALECAVALQRAFAARNETAAEPIRVRIGINAGEPITEDGDLFGTSVTMASRIAGTAAGGEIIASNVVRELVAGKGFLFSDRGDSVLRGFDDPVRLYELRWQE